MLSFILATCPAHFNYIDLTTLVNGAYYKIPRYEAFSTPRSRPIWDQICDFLKAYLLKFGKHSELFSFWKYTSNT